MICTIFLERGQTQLTLSRHPLTHYHCSLCARKAMPEEYNLATKSPNVNLYNKESGKIRHFPENAMLIHNLGSVIKQHYHFDLV